MRLYGYIIITLPDFARFFEVAEFWANRSSFVRDMHPNRVYYWNNTLKTAYDKVCEWILAEDSNSSSDRLRNEAVRSLNILTNRKIEMSDFLCYFEQKGTDTTSDIITINAPTSLKLDRYTVDAMSDYASIRLHKIRVVGAAGQKSEIKIGNETVGILECGEVAYVTETNGMFIELLPNHISNNFFDARLLDNGNNFRSILAIKDKRSNLSDKIRDVVSFALVEDGYLYIDFQDTITYNNVNFPIFMLNDEDCKAIAVNYIDGVCYALYENRNLRSTKSFNSHRSIFTNPNKLNSELWQK